MVPCVCKWAWVWLLAGRGFSAVAPSQCARAAKAMEGSFLPALDKDQAYMFIPSELRLYWHAQDHRLLSRDILGYPSLFQVGNILAQPLISKVILFSGGQWNFEGLTRPAATARQPGAEMNEKYGMSTSQGISQDNSASNFYPDLFASLAFVSQLIQGYASLEILSQLILWSSQS